MYSLTNSFTRRFIHLFKKGLGSALSPAELRAAEAAEQLLEQEKRDALLAQRLQVY